MSIVQSAALISQGKSSANTERGNAVAKFEWKNEELDDEVDEDIKEKADSVDEDEDLENSGGDGY